MSCFHVQMLQNNDSDFHKYLASDKKTNVSIAKCEQGICIKWTKYRQGELRPRTKYHILAS